MGSNDYIAEYHVDCNVIQNASRIFRILDSLPISGIRVQIPSKSGVDQVKKETGMPSPLRNCQGLLLRRNFGDTRTARQTGVANKKAPWRCVRGLIEDIMKVKGIGDRIDRHNKNNFILELGGFVKLLCPDCAPTPWSGLRAGTTNPAHANRLPPSHKAMAGKSSI